MEAYPDSALRILENVEPQQLKTPANQAYYALLLTQARDKNYIVQTDDSDCCAILRLYLGGGYAG